MVKKLAALVVFALMLGFAFTGVIGAQTPTISNDEAVTEESTQSAEEKLVFPTAVPRTDITQSTEEALGPLENMLNEQKLGTVLLNPIKHAIRNAVAVGVPANTIVLLLLLPLVAAITAAARNFVGIRGFGIFLPTALSVVFLATGPVVGIGLFLVIVAVSTMARMVLRKTKIKLQYLPRMSLLLLFVVIGVLGVLFLAPVLRHPDLTNVSIFPVLILVLLAEDFSRVQIGKSAKTAVNLTTETLILALVSFVFLTFEPVQKYALLNPEILLVAVFIFNIIIGKYVGLRFVEYWRLRKLISG
jgi:hypothetical protein